MNEEAERRAKREEKQRLQRAQGLVALGLVARAGEAAFVVSTPFVRERRRSYRVWRDEERRVRCECEEFAAAAKSQPKYRCVHILAAKHAVETDRVVVPKEPPPPAEPPAREASRALARHASTPVRRPAIEDACRLPARFERLVAGHTLREVTEALDRVTPTWQHRIDSLSEPEPGTVAVTVTVTVGGTEHTGTGTGLARGELGVRRAESEATRRAAVQFERVARLLEGGPHHPGASAGTGAATPFKFRGSPEAKSVRNAITRPQRDTLDNLARALDSDSEAECRKVFRCGVDLISKRAASRLINYLTGLAAARHADTPLRRAG